MKILFTNNALGARAGTELFIRDLALALSKRGHQVAAYSNILGEVAEELTNFVDLDRFQPRGPLPIHPRRALIFGNYAREDFHVPPIQEACQKAGLTLELAGSGVRRLIARPEDLLGSFDIVFAKGRCALEALATGAAVIILYKAGLGCLVKSKDLTRTLQLNFGSNGNIAPLTCQNVLSEIAKYDPEDAARVSQKIREKCGLVSYLDKLLFFYTGALERYDRISISREEEASSEADYLKKISHLLNEQSENIAESQIASLNRGVAERNGQIASLNQQAAEREEHIASLNQAAAERDGRIINLTNETVRVGEWALHLDTELNNADKKLHAITQSNSWRLTLPLRKIRRWLSKHIPVA